MVLPDPGTPRFGYQPQSCNNDVGERFFEGKLTADPAKRIAAKLAGITGTLNRCGAGQHDRNLPVSPTPHIVGAVPQPGVGSRLAHAYRPDLLRPSVERQGARSRA